ncbi:hypothetical protein SNEBB_004099 [Seison nebaliae]|nr:hypothetical protein SNEBB_004099 [Seison nebaliae]
MTFNYDDGMIIDDVPKRESVDNEKLNDVERLMNSKSYLFHMINHQILENCSGKKILFLCFGLGNISKNRYARYQLKFWEFIINSIKNYFKDGKFRVLFSDPIFTNEEINFLEKKYESECLTFNTFGKYVVDDFDLTVTFFPFVCNKLINNFMETNWHNRQNTILISTSLKGTNLLVKESNKKLFPILNKILEMDIQEFPIYQKSEKNDIYWMFNDLCFFLFPKENI